MANQGMCLAEEEGFGRVYDCGSCGNIHLQVGPVSLTLEPKAYMQLVAMILNSAAAFEGWQQRNDAGNDVIRREAEPVVRTNFNSKGIQ